MVIEKWKLKEADEELLCVRKIMIASSSALKDVVINDKAGLIISINESLKLAYDKCYRIKELLGLVP